MAAGELTRVDAVTRMAIHDLVTEHSYLADHGDADALAALYTHDGELIGMPPRNLVGADQIRRWGRERVRRVTRALRLVESSPRLGWAGDRLQGTLNVVMFLGDTPGQPPSSPTIVGEYLDEYAVEDGSWRIRRREIRRIFSAPANVHAPGRGADGWFPFGDSVTPDDH